MSKSLIISFALSLELYFFYLTHSAYLKVTFFPYLKTSKQFYSLLILGINIIQCEGLLAWILAFQDQRQKL